uniref:Uncharacterized protein n=1 Tax=Eptatretus burgeri TaxID=7764 RepID=A0A8C4QQ22_EPTBU
MPQTPGKRCHGCLALAMVLASQALTDTFLVAQKPQGQRLGISILIMVGDFCFLLVLRYVAVCVSDEATTTRRAYSSIQWFLYVFVLEIKLYFVCQNYRNNGNDSTLARKLFTLSLSICVPGLYVLLIAADRLDCLRQLAPTDTVASIKDEEADEGNDHSCESPTSDKALSEDLSGSKGIESFARSGHRHDRPLGIADLRSERTLTLTEYAHGLLLLQKKEDIRSHVFIVALDILDILDVQAAIWEQQTEVKDTANAAAVSQATGGIITAIVTQDTGLPPLWAENLTFFYCYILLLGAALRITK